MRIRILLFTIIFSLAAFPVLAQNRALRAADDAFNNMQYNVALTKYKKALSKAKAKPDKEKISFQIAECYRIINNTKKAEASYKRLAKTKYADSNPLVSQCSGNVREWLQACLTYIYLIFASAKVQEMAIGFKMSC